jgi:acyl-CoA thioester hydrolase
MDVRVGVKVTRLGHKSFTIQQAVIEHTTGKVMCSGEVVVVAYDYHTHQTIPIPPEWREKLTAFENL